MRVGIIGTGAISHKHAEAYRNIGYDLTVCTDIHPPSGKAFAELHGCEFVPTYEEVCRHPRVDYVDVCTFPDFRLQPLRICAETGKHVQVQKPIATSLQTAEQMVELADSAGIQLGVVSQHRFDDSTLFLRTRLRQRPLGQDRASRRLCEVVPVGGVLLAADQRELGDRRRRGADQSGHPPGGHSAMADRRHLGRVRHVAAWRPAQASNRKTW